MIQENKLKYRVKNMFLLITALIFISKLRFPKRFSIVTVYHKISKIKIYNEKDKKR